MMTPSMRSAVEEWEQHEAKSCWKPESRREPKPMRRHLPALLASVPREAHLTSEGRMGARG